MPRPAPSLPATVLALLGAATLSARLSATHCTSAQPPFVSDFGIYQPMPTAEPLARVPYRDPVFKTCVTRVTDRTKDIAAGDGSGGLKNEYSRVQSFNADESRILVRGTAATWYLYDAATFQPLGKLSFEGAVDPRWDATNPDILYYCDGPTLTRYDTRSQQPSVLHDFTSDFPGQTLAFVWTRYEGGPSIDGRWWGLMAQDSQDHVVAFLVYDQKTDQITARRDVRGVTMADTVDSVSISPLGTYFAAYFDYCPTGTLGTDASPCGFMVYDRSLKNGRGLLRIIGHSDFALDAERREVLVFQDIDTDNLSVLDLATGSVTPLWPIDFSFTSIGFHLSGRSFRLPGWATISTTHSDVVSHTWMDDEVFVMELKPSGRVFRLAHTHSVVDPAEEHDYWAEPQASANRDLTKILFTTNWGRSGTDQVEMYAIELPEKWSGDGGGGYLYTVPAAAHSPGTLGSLWRTNVAVVNLGASAASLQLIFVPVGGSAQTKGGTVPASGTREWVDVLASLFGYVESAQVSGALSISSDQPLLVTSRTFNQGTAGTYGGFLPGLGTSGGLTTGQTGYLAQLKRNGAFRTNIGVTNLGTSDVSVVIRLWGANGAALGAPIPVTVPAEGLNQVTNVFGVAGAGDREIAYATIVVQTIGGRVWAWASVIDNATGDPTNVPIVVR